MRCKCPCKCGLRAFGRDLCAACATGYHERPLTRQDEQRLARMNAGVSDVARVRGALHKRGRATTRELAQDTGLPVKTVGIILANTGARRLRRGYRGHTKWTITEASAGKATAGEMKEVHGALKGNSPAVAPNALASATGVSAW